MHDVKDLLGSVVEEPAAKRYARTDDFILLNRVTLEASILVIKKSSHAL
jgi:hypothetical protein